MKLLLLTLLVGFLPLSLQAGHNICFVTTNLPMENTNPRPPEIWKLGLIGLAATSFLIRKRL